MEAQSAVRAPVEVPVIDLTPARAGQRQDRQRVAAAIDAACREIGFFAVTGHGVPDRCIDALREAAHAFFALPPEEKAKACDPDRRVNRGYRPPGDETLSATYASGDGPAPPDLKEFYHVGPVDVTSAPYYTSRVGRRYFPPNVWPQAPAAFEAAATAYYRAMHALVQELMRLTALALGVDEAFFDDKVDRPIGTMRLNYYPAQTVPPLPGQLRASPHTDYGGFTILSGEDVAGGLQVRTRQGTWIDVHTEPSELVVNIGDLLMRWTNDRWLSNVHRVVNPPRAVAPSSPRLSVAFFNHPNYNVLIECVAPPGEARHEPVLSGEYRDRQYRLIGLGPD